MTVSVKPRLKVGSKGGVWGGMPVSKRVQAYYEGASRTYRMGDKGLHVGGPNTDIAASLNVLRKRSRNIIQNNAIGEAAITTYVANVIGKGIKAKFNNDALQKLWNDWTLECDADGLSNFAGLQELVCRAEFSDGEGLARLRPRRITDGLSVPLQIQLIECDYLDEGFTDYNKNIRNGIQFNTSNERTYYHIYKNHPSESFTNNNRIAVSAKNIIHVFRRLRIGQVRGVPKLANILVKLYEIDEMQDGMLAKQKIAQLFGWIIKRKGGDAAPVTQEENVVGEDTGQTTQDGTIITKIKSGGVHYLDEDEEVEFSTPDGIGSNYIPWLKQELRLAAKGVGLTYEQLTGDLEGVNYSSIRAGLIEFRRSIEQVQYNLYVHRFCHKIAEWFVDTAVLSGKVVIPDYWGNKYDYLPKWRAQGWDWVDPVKDKMGDFLDLRMGVNSRRGVIESRGGDFESINDDIDIDAKSGRILDSIPAKTNKAGTLQTVIDYLEEDENEQKDD